MTGYARRGADIQQCRECGTKFDLNSVSYYTNLCPRCMPEDGAECPFCGDAFDPAEGVTTQHYHTNGQSETLTVCSTECASNDEMRGPV